jgi:hypothetical protein
VLLPTSSGERLPRRLEFWPHHDRAGRLLGVLGVIREADSEASAPESESSISSIEMVVFGLKNTFERLGNAPVGVRAAKRLGRPSQPQT